MKKQFLALTLVILSTVCTNANQQGINTSVISSCGVSHDAMSLINIEKSIIGSMEKLMTLRNNSQDKYQFEYYQIQIDSLRAEYLKCDLFLKHALLNR
jgi:hypothetical protein